MEHLLDYNEEILKLSQDYLKANFIVLRPTDIKIKNSKYPIYDLQDEDESSIGGYLKANDFCYKKIKRFIYHKYKFFNKRVIVIFGIKTKYKRRQDAKK